MTYVTFLHKKPIDGLGDLFIYPFHQEIPKRKIDLF